MPNKRLLFSLALAILAPTLSLRAGDDDSESRRVPALSESFYKSGSRVLSIFKPVSTATRDSVGVVRSGGERIALATVVDANGYLVTKASELAKASAITVTLSSGTVYTATIVGTDDATDLALLKIPARGLKPVQWDPAPVDIGEWIATPGVDPTPEAVGIVSVTPRAIPRERALMGVRMQTGTPVIEGIMPGFGAEYAGLARGDTIVRVDGHQIATYEELTTDMQSYRAGDSIAVDVKRGEKTVTVSVRLTADSVITAAMARGTGAPPPRSDRMNKMGSGVSDRSKDFASVIQHDTVLQPWQCGGPLVSLSGKVVGINIARAGRVATYALPAHLAAEVVARLLAEARAT